MASTDAGPPSAEWEADRQRFLNARAANPPSEEELNGLMDGRLSWKAFLNELERLAGRARPEGGE